MTFTKSIEVCFNKYATFSGRASRSEFWWFYLFGILGGIIAGIIDVMIFGYSIEVTGPMGWIFTIVLLLPSIAVGARRLHDVGKSGWWQLLYFVLIIGWDEVQQFEESLLKTRV